MTALSPPVERSAADVPDAPRPVPGVERSRVTTRAVLRGVGALLAVAAVVVAVHLLLGHRADETRASREFTELVSYEVWRSSLGVTVALWAAAGAAAAVRLRALPGGLARGPVLLASGAWLVVVAALLAFLASSSGGPDNPLWGSRPKVLGLVAVTLLLASPLAVGLWCARAWLEDLGAELRRPDTAVPVGRRVSELLVVRRTIDASLKAGALGLTAVVVATGALRNALIESGRETEASWPPSLLLVYGGVFTVVFAAVLVPAHLRWDAVADALVEHAVPLPDDGTPPDTWHDRRRSLRTVLGREQSFTTRLGSGLAIGAPLVTSALAAFVPQLAS